MTAAPFLTVYLPKELQIMQKASFLQPGEHEEKW